MTQPNTTPPKEILVREDFNDPQGQLKNYAAYEVDKTIAISKQKHVDIRVIQQEDLTSQVLMIHLDQFAMNDLNAYTMADLEGDVVVKQGEKWVGGTVAKDPTRNNWRILSASLTTGNNVISSVIPKHG